jgi:hypothetical protein
MRQGLPNDSRRSPHSPYKCGRSTEREAWLLKIKRFEDAEAVVLEPYEGIIAGDGGSVGPGQKPPMTSAHRFPSASME